MTQTILIELQKKGKKELQIIQVVPNASFTEDLGADSLDAVELIMAIEEAFDIEIPDEEVRSELKESIPIIQCIN